MESEDMLLEAMSAAPEDARVGPVLAKIRETAQLERRLSKLQEARNQGNLAVKSGDIEHGAFCYEQGLSDFWCQTLPNFSVQDRVEPPSLEERRAGLSAEATAAANDEALIHCQATLRAAEAAVINNLALCYLRGNASTEWPSDPERASCLCELALLLDPGNVKAIFRRGQALLGLGRLIEAELELARAARESPSDSNIRAELRKVREARRTQAVIHWGEKEKRALGNWCDRLSGFASPDADVATSGKTWPETLKPAPARELGIERLVEYAEGLAETLVDRGLEAFTMEVLGIIREAVVSEYGEAFAKQLARVVPVVQAKFLADAGNGSICRSPMDGPRLATPFYDVAPGAWGEAMAKESACLFAEISQCESSSWEAVPNSNAEQIVLLEHGIWIAGSTFPRSLASLSKLEDFCPYSVNVLRVPPGVEMRTRHETSSFVVTALLHLQPDSTAKAVLRVGDEARDVMGSEVVLFGQCFPHALVNVGAEAQLFLCCSFFHPETLESERFALLAADALSEALSGIDLYRQFRLLPDGVGPEILRQVQDLGLSVVA